MSSMDSSDDFFNNFDRGSPAKPSLSLKPPPTSGNGSDATAGLGAVPPTMKPRPPPPPPRPASGTTSRFAVPPIRASSKPSAAVSATATRTTTPSPQPTSTTPPQFYAAASQKQQQQQPTAPSPAAAAAISSSYPTTQTSDASETPTTTKEPAVRSRPVTRSRIAAGGTRSAAASTTASSASYYGQQQQPKQQPTSLVSKSGSSGQFQNVHLTAPSPAPIQPTMFNPAAAAASSAYSQSNNSSYYNYSGANTLQQQQPDPTDGDWFTPDVDSSEDTIAPLIPRQEPVVAPQRKPLGQAAYFRSTSSLEGNMDGALSGVPASAPSMFVPVAPTSGGYMSSMMSSNPTLYSNEDLENEPPLLEELGINIDHILAKTKAVVVPFKRFSGDQSALLDPAMIVEDADLAGPTAFALLLGGELLLTGKIHFGYIYGFGVFGCLAMTLILNLMSPSQAVSVWTVTSILGYSLLPVNLLAAVKIILVNIANLSTLGQILAFLTILWSTTASTRLLEVGCGMRNQRYLLAYPIALLYSAFVLITIF